MRYSRLGRMAVVLMAMVLFGGSAEAAAQAKKRRKVVIIPGVKIEGRIQKPQAFYILQRSNLNFEGLELKNSFVPKIIRSVEQPPF